ncbi:hypothetical protein GS597_14185 [Synechococcales cyanobacterium C]|uniref:Uncharacterized protein n=1 Tax=Petrachloros mirabilis ULC683 TaxID=2781853 RepID=A0A8K2A0R9_9CYAN|nr:hypothetical protein [Petrachloros mirabilis]NCJ07636.1 hypothetical protein [Petrachloros mirabilis ULC683]
MSSDPIIPKESALTQTDDTALTTTPGQDDIRDQTEALIEAIKKRAQDEVQSAETLTRDAYLAAVQRARELVEQNKLLDPQQIEDAYLHLQQDAEKNWQSVLQEMTDFGDRLAEAAKTAWQVLFPEDPPKP